MNNMVRMSAGVRGPSVLEGARRHQGIDGQSLVLVDRAIDVVGVVVTKSDGLAVARVRLRRRR